MAERCLRLEVRTPRGLVAELDARSLRVPADTGQVGLRPRCEPAVLAVEPGLVLAWTDAGTRFLATAGGLLRCDGQRAIVLTPLAVLGEDAAQVQARLAEALEAAGSDRELRQAIERLETGILRELRQETGPSRSAPGGA